MSKKTLQQKPKRSEEVEKWLEEEFGEQKERYEKIAKEMNIDLAKDRKGTRTSAGDRRSAGFAQEPWKYGRRSGTRRIERPVRQDWPDS